MNKELIAIQRECDRRDTELSHTVDTRLRTTAAIANRDWCNLHVPELVVNYRSKFDEYWRLFRIWFGEVPPNATEREIDDQIHEARLYKIGRTAFLLVETIAAAVLAAIFFNAPRLVAILIGAGLAYLFGAAAAPVVARWVRHDAANQPTKQMGRVTRGLLALGLPWLLACVIALAILRSQGTAIGTILFFIATTTVTLLSPLCSGLCGYAAGLLSWSHRLCADMRWIRALARALDHLLATSERAIPAAPGALVPPAGPVSRVIKAIAPPVTVTILLIAALFGAPSVGQAADIPVYIYSDVSASARAGDVVDTLKAFTAKLSNYDGTETLSVSVVPFYEQAFTAKATAQVRIPGTRAVSCPEAAVNSEIARLSRSYADAEKQKAAQKCDLLRTQARRDSDAQRASEIAKLMAAIDGLSGLKITGRCTAVNAMIRRAAGETPKGVSIIISDLQNTCASSGLPTGVKPDNQVFVIPVASRDRSVEEGFDALQLRFTRALPWLQVIESYRLDTIMNAILHPEVRMARR